VYNVQTSEGAEDEDFEFCTSRQEERQEVGTIAQRETDLSQMQLVENLANKLFASLDAHSAVTQTKIEL
jgi:hypothetical protein